LDNIIVKAKINWLWIYKLISKYLFIKLLLSNVELPILYY
jgi:hypothetical protein